MFPAPTVPIIERPCPTFIEPQLATFAVAPPVGPDWLFERKYDGYRLQVHMTGSNIVCFSRSGHDLTNKLSTLLPFISTLPVQSAVLDGELCAWSEDGTTHLGQLSASLHHGGPFRLHVFDLLHLNGRDLCALPLLERKSLLSQIMPSSSHGDLVSATNYQLTDGAKLFQHMAAAGHEGIIAKRAYAPYRPGVRAPEWRKIKVTQEQRFEVIGWQTDATNTFMTSLVLAQNAPALSNNSLCLQYRGRVGTGFSVTQRLHLHQLLDQHETDRAQCAVPPHLKSARWCRGDRLGTANIRFAEISNNGVLRSPTFIGWNALPGSQMP